VISRDGQRDMKGVVDAALVLERDLERPIEQRA
jgi:hypothetical protein